MSFEIKTIPRFEREAEKLSKKYHSFKKDLTDLIESLEENPQQGISLGHNFYKIRLSITSKGKGKSGGARVITCVIMLQQKVFPCQRFRQNAAGNHQRQRTERVSENYFIISLRDFS